MRNVLSVVIVSLLLAACGPKSDQISQDANVLATLVQQGVEQTVAAASPTPEPTFTPQPTATARPVKKIGVISSDFHLYTINTDGSSLNRMTSNENLEGTYDISSDGQWVAYETNVETENSADIYIMRFDGSEAHKLVAHSQNDFNPAWSPDGSQLLFMSDMTSNGHDRDIFVVNADGSGLFNLSASSNFDVEPVWSPDGTRIAFRSGKFMSDEELANFGGSSSQTSIVVKDITSGGTVYLPMPEGLGSPSYPQWSPDGNQITFNCAGLLEKPDEVDVFTTYQGLCFAMADGSYSKVLYTAEWSMNAGAPNYKADATWTPDGSRITFVGLLEDGVTSEIFTMNPDGSEIQQITTSTTQLKMEPAWSKDGSMLLFMDSYGPLLRRNFTVYAVYADGSGLTLLYERSRQPPMPKWVD
jgi:Tol biopolymer transport system component